MNIRQFYIFVGHVNQTGYKFNMSFTAPDWAVVRILSILCLVIPLFRALFRMDRDIYWMKSVDYISQGNQRVIGFYCEYHGVGEDDEADMEAECEAMAERELCSDLKESANLMKSIQYRLSDSYEAMQEYFQDMYSPCDPVMAGPVLAGLSDVHKMSIREAAPFEVSKLNQCINDALVDFKTPEQLDAEERQWRRVGMRLFCGAWTVGTCLALIAVQLVDKV